MHRGDVLAAFGDDLFHRRAGDLFFRDQRQIAPHFGESGQRPVMHGAVRPGSQGGVVEFAQIDARLDGELFGQVGREFAEVADRFPFQQNLCRLARMQEGFLCGDIGKAHAERRRQRLERALGGEEIFPRPVHADGERFALFGQFGQRKLPREVDVRQLVQARRLVAAADVALERGEHRGRERGAHDAHVFADGVFDADGLFRLALQAQQFVIFGGNEGIGDDLGEVLPAHGGLGALFGALRRVQSAVRDARLLQEGALDGVVPVHADDLFGEVGEALDVLAVGGRRDGERVAARGDAEIEAGEDVFDLLFGNLDAEQAVDRRNAGTHYGGVCHGQGAARRAADAHLFVHGGNVGAADVQPQQRVGRADRLAQRLFVLHGDDVPPVGSDGAAAQGADQVQGAVDGDARRVGVDALFKAGGRIALLPQRARGAADVGALEFGAFEEDLFRVLRDAAVQPAHDPGEGDGLFRVADDEVFGMEFELLFVEGGDGLPLFGAPHDDLPAAHFGEVERVHGLTQFEQDEVGDVDHVVDGAQAAQREAAAQPLRRLFDLQVGHAVGDVARAQIGREHRNAHPFRSGRLPRGVGQIERGERLFEHGRHFARDAVDALAVGPVGGDGDVEDVIVQPHDLFDVGADGDLSLQKQDAVDVGAFVPVVVDAQFLARAEHAARLDAAQFPLFDLHAAVQRRAIQRDGDEVALVHVVRACDDLQFPAVFAAVEGAYEQMVGIGMGHDARDLPDDAAVDLRPGIHQFFDLEPAGKELVFQFFGRDVDVYIIFEPAERRFHDPFNPPMRDFPPVSRGTV